MSSQIVSPFGQLVVAVPAAAKVATFSQGSEQYDVNQPLGYPNQPPSQSNLFTGSGAFTSAAYTLAGTAVINAGAYPVLVNVGTDANVFERGNFQPTPGVLNATGALTAAMILAGIVTSTTGAAVAATLPTGAVMDAAATFAIGDSFDWTAIATGANAFTLQPAANHTIVGVAAVATVTSGRFRTTKTAAGTFVTYRLS
ncbi:MAG: hypothetical protein RLZZ200_1107 [Pseudomonadota bacterium]|jgi:hypothetical protein